MTDLLQRQNSTKESEGFNVQSFNYGESDTVAHVIAHRNITAELSLSDICEDNDLYFGGNEMTHLENAIGIIIASITVVFIYCGLALIEILDRIANMF